MILSDKEIADWLTYTLRLYGVSEVNVHKIVGLFLEALES